MANELNQENTNGFISDELVILNQALVELMERGYSRAGALYIIDNSPRTSGFTVSDLTESNMAKTVPIC